MTPNIDGFPAYHVTRDGRVFRILKGNTTGNVGELTQQLRNKYKCVTLFAQNIRKMFSVHRLVGLAYIQNTDDKPMINHINGIKTDNNVDNLEWVTSIENVKHAIDNSLTNYKLGENTSNNKLSNIQVYEIKQLLKTNITQRAIAELYGISEGNVTSIKNGNTWSHIT